MLPHAVKVAPETLRNKTPSPVSLNMQQQARMATASPNILIVEDNLVNRELLREFVEGWGYRVLEAANGAEGLQQIEELTPDLVLMDIEMPVMDGYVAIERIRKSLRSP